MTIEIFSVLAILLVALVLFVTEKLRMDLVALLVLSALAVGGLVTPGEAVAGFSNPAVITVWAMFILSAGLSATGVADVIGRQVLRLAGDTEPRMIMAIMLTAGGLSAFMNNIGVAALMLPVVIDISRRTGTSPSRLLMPMAYGSLLGGLTTLIGTPPNLVASTALREAGHGGYQLFEFAPIGIPALLLGALFVAFVGRHLLPSEMPEGMDGRGAGFVAQYSHRLDEQRFVLRIGDDSPFDGAALEETPLAAMLGLHVLHVQRGDDALPVSGGGFVLRGGDRLVVQGRVGDFEEFLKWQALEMASGEDMMLLLCSSKIMVVSARVADGSELSGMTVEECDFNRRFHAHIVWVRRGDRVLREHLEEVELRAGDVLLLNGRSEDLDSFGERPEFDRVETVSEEQLSDVYSRSDTLLELELPEDAHLAGQTLAESGLYESFRLRVLGIVRKGSAIYFPPGDQRLESGDRLLVHGRSESVERIAALQGLTLEHGEIPSALDGDASSLCEVTLAPGSGLVGKTLRELDFRRRYGLAALSIWRGGRAYRSHLRNMRLQFGDALLLSGDRERIAALGADDDFLVLASSAGDEPKATDPRKALLAATVMLAVVVPVLAGWLPIAIAAVAGSALMVACRCLSMDDAYRAIDWKSVFLIAGMTPLGSAMASTGAAEWIAGGVSAAVAPFGTWGVLAGLYLLTAACTTIVPTTALVLIMAPIAISMSLEIGLPPQMLMMAIAMSASASFTSPISHPANVLVMGPGGYRFMDYVKLGVLLAAVVMLTVLPLIVLVY